MKSPKKKFGLALAVFLGVAATSGSAFAVLQFRGSDTMYDLMTQAITQLALQADLQYLGGGSTIGENGLVAGTQTIAPMSRPLKQSAIDAAAAKGNTLLSNVVALDAVSIYTKAGEPVSQSEIPVLKNIFCGVDGAGGACVGHITDWSNVPGSGKIGPINAFRRNDLSGTTDTFKSLVACTNFCSDVVVVNDNDPVFHPEVASATDKIREETSTNPQAIAYAGESALDPTVVPSRNQRLDIQNPTTLAYVTPSTATVQDFSYPLSRRLFINEVVGPTIVRTPAEQTVLDFFLDPVQSDSLIVANEFTPCLTRGVAPCSYP
jgi:phosphate transport system substrate-binding protein